MDENTLVDAEGLPSASAVTEQLPGEAPLQVVGSPPSQDLRIRDEVWYLGLDLGTTGLSGVLLNQTTGQVYPLSWWPQATTPGPTPSYRLPVAGYLSAAQLAQLQVLQAPSVVAPLAIADLPTNGLVLQNFKSHFKVGIPYAVPASPEWQPLVQWSEQQPLPLVWLHQALTALLTAIAPSSSQPNAAFPWKGEVVGLSPERVEAAFRHLAGVVVGYPATWPDSYRFNLREAVLRAHLVEHPEQIFFVEDAIAAVLSEIPRWSRGETGSILTISSGATTTELALVNIPANLQDLTHADFHLSSLSYAGNALDQDIICQLLYPLELAGLDLPLPGEPDLAMRYRLHQRLVSTATGQRLLEAAKYLKLILQDQDSFTLELDNQRRVVLRRQLESQILVPFVQRLNRELNTLLSYSGVLTQAVKQVICTGGTASLPAIARWLRQKFPNATIIQDTYTPEALSTLHTSTCSRIAYGLANLPLYPQVLDLPRQQYSDQFLLLELLRVVSEHRPALGTDSEERQEEQGGFSVATIMQQLQRRGINVQVCQLQILALLEGQLPPSILVSDDDAALLALTSQLQAQALKAPLFSKVGTQTYCPNGQQCQFWLEYFRQILAGTVQKLEDPLVGSLVAKA